MAEPDITIKRGDTGKVLTGQFVDRDGAAIVCTGATAPKVFMRPRSGSTLKINGSAFTFTNAALGRWSYTCAAGDVDTVGTYKMEFQFTLGSQIVTIPTEHGGPFLIVLIQDDLGS